ncbi:MAG TPA: hypothetical protein P5181_15350, partial [Dermatophilaceae bacterium]|nr:hypothetical protein [Dermatophilaceae bacterium]
MAVSSSSSTPAPSVGTAAGAQAVSSVVPTSDAVAAAQATTQVSAGPDSAAPVAVAVPPAPVVL